MIDLVQNKLDELKTICKTHTVKSLYLFGSAAKETFHPASSDLDFVVEFNANVDPLDFADNFFSLLEALQKLYGKKIDLLSYRALKNKIIISEIEHSKVQLYAA